MVHPFYKQDPYYCEQCLWIHPARYQSLLNRFTGGLPLNVAGTQGRSANLALDTTPLLLVSGVITPATGEMVLFPWYALDPGLWTPPHPGPYEIVFVDAGGQAIAAYTHTFDVGSTLVPSDAALVQNDDGEAFFMFVIPYPAHAARVQVYRSADNTLLAERVVSATPPALTLNPLASVWSGAQTLTWHTDTGTRYFALDISTDGGASWEGLAINLTTPEATLHTASFPNTAETFIRVDATDGWHTTSVITGPFTIANPPLVSYVAPPPNSVADPALPVVVSFRDAMDAATLHTQTITLNGGPYGTVSGAVTYDALEREVTFTPHAPLAHDTVYTAQVGIDVRDSAGASLPVTFTWSFTTTIDTLPPVPLAVSPGKGAQRTPTDTSVVVLWDKALDPATLTPERFTLATAEGITVSGMVAYDAAAHTLIFQPATDLLTGTLYVATLHPGIADLVGNETVGDYRWSFRTGAHPPSALAFTGSYADWGVDTNGDGLYEHLIIQAGVQVTATGDYVLRGVLADAQGDEIAWSHITTTLTAGTHFLSLTFDGAAIGGRGTDGPYTLAALTAHSAVTPQTRLPEIVSQQNVYRTFAYPAAHFPTPLRFGELPDVLLLPGTAALDAFNVRDYAQHALLSSDQLSYTITLNANPRMSVTLRSSGIVRVVPEAYWEGRTSITLRASDGVHTVQDTFEAAIGWPRALYLPVVLRAYGGPVALRRNAWITVVEDDFESSFNWSLYSSMDITNQPWREYYWAKRDCRAHSGQYSAWAYGGGADGGAVACGAEHPQALWALMYKATPINLKYVAQAEYNAKVWTNLNAGDEVCLKVAVIDSGYCQGEYGWPVAFTYGICRSGQTNGWEDLTLDLANVPQLGNVLGEERVCLGVTFQTQYDAVRPEGAYVDDVSLRLCPEGLSAHCEGANAAPPTSPALVAGNIGGYPEEIDTVALAVEDNGRVHALWTGKLNPNFQNFVFYSSSPDGMTWMPYQIFSTWGGREPQIAVDAENSGVHGRVHLAYANDDGIVHRTVTNGVISAPEIVAPHQPHRSPGTPYEGGYVAWPSLAVAEESGYAYLVWRQTHFVRTAADAHSMRYITWHAYWDAAGGGWSAPLRKINDRDTFYSSIAAATDGQVMLAWFPRWQQSHGGGVGPGDPIVARTAYGTEPGRFPLRQATHDLYPSPQRDESILLAYSGGDDSFVLASNHFMYPGHSRAYRYVWKDGVWSEPLNVAENDLTGGWGVPFYVGAATNTPLIRYVYSDDWVLKMRTETNGVLSPAQNVADYLSARDYTGSPAAYFTDAAGGLHMVVKGEKNGVAGFYYVKP